MTGVGDTPVPELVGSILDGLTPERFQAELDQANAEFDAALADGSMSLPDVLRHQGGPRVTPALIEKWPTLPATGYTFTVCDEELEVTGWAFRSPTSDATGHGSDRSFEPESSPGAIVLLLRSALQPSLERRLRGSSDADSSVTVVVSNGTPVVEAVAVPTLVTPQRLEFRWA